MGGFLRRSQTAEMSRKWKAFHAPGRPTADKKDACRRLDIRGRLPTMPPNGLQPHPGASRLAEPLEQAPDSSPLRVSSHTTLESGIPPARLREDRGSEPPSLTLDDGVERMDAALAGAARTEANLSLLFRGLKHLADGAVIARSANEELSRELDSLRAHLARGDEAEQALRFRISHLQQSLEVMRRESARERAFLIEQQDQFLVEIMEDHERQVTELQRQLRDVSTRKVDPAQLSELTGQRDQAREYALRCERERDLAWQELAALGGNELPVPTLRRPTPAPLANEVPGTPSTTGNRGSTAIGALNLRTVQVPTRNPSESRPAVAAYSSPGMKDDPTE